jgi:hypothetical protein
MPEVFRVFLSLFKRILGKYNEIGRDLLFKPYFLILFDALYTSAVETESLNDF